MCAPRAAAQGTAPRAVKVLASHQILPEPLLEGEAVMSAPPFFQSAGQEDLKFWEEEDGPTVPV